MDDARLAERATALRALAVTEATRADTERGVLELDDVGTES